MTLGRGHENVARAPALAAVIALESKGGMGSEEEHDDVPLGNEGAATAAPFFALMPQSPRKYPAVIIVTGTRAQGTSPTESLSPVSVVGGAALTEQAAPSLTDALTNIAPSINTQRFPIADGTAFVRPVSLRNLAPDQTLVLVNSTRRHRSALVNLQTEPFGTVNQGAQAVDFGLIPSIAIDRIEVLRDGASAQYGSDAVAGVVNIILREDSGVHLTAQYGEAYEGDGENYTIAGSVGTALGERGFVNLSLEYADSQITSRGSARPDAAAVAAVVGAENVPFDGLGQRWGDPDIESFRGFVNAAYEITDEVEWYGHGSYADGTSFSGFFYRTPFGVPGVGPRGTLCQCTDGVPNNTDQAVVDAIIADGLNPADYLTADANSPSGWVNLNPIWTQFPGGYNPTFGADIKDFEVVSGLRGEFPGDVTWDLSGRYGENKLSYFLDNSINPSLGRLSPTSFRPGDLEQRETGVNFDVVVPFEAGLAAPINVALGAEWRREEYVIRELNAARELLPAICSTPSTTSRRTLACSSSSFSIASGDMSSPSLALISS